MHLPKKLRGHDVWSKSAIPLNVKIRWTDHPPTPKIQSNIPEPAVVKRF